MTFIILIAIVLYFILVAWTWQSLGLIEKPKKVVFLILGMMLVYGITWFIFGLTKESIAYEKETMQKSVQNILVLIFTGINGMIIMPQIAKLLDKVKEEQMDPKIALKRLLLWLTIWVVCLFWEVGYMKDIQQGILQVYHANKK